MRFPYVRRVVLALVLVAPVVFVFSIRSKVASSEAPTLVPSITATKTAALVAGNGDADADPGDTIEYTITVNNIAAPGAGNDATGLQVTDQLLGPQSLVAGSPNILPNARNDTYDTIGNTQLQVAATQTVFPGVFVNGNVKTNDVDFDGTFTITAFDAATTQGGAVTMNTGTGEFTYTPDDGDAGIADTFTYTVTDDKGATDIATVTININAQKVWYVRNNQAAGGLGRSGDPFDTLLEAQTASVAGDTIYVFTGDGTTLNQNAGFTMKGTQRLLGEGVALTVPVAVNGGPNPTVLRAAGTAPMIDNTAGNAVAITNITGVLVTGLNIGSSNNSAVDISTTAANNAGAEIALNTIRNSTTEGIDVNGGSTGTTTVSIHDNTITSTGNGIDIVRTAGTLNVTAFDDNVITGTTGGIGINIVGAVTFDAIPGGAFNTVSGGNTVIGAAGAGNGAGTGGITMTAVSGDLNFTDLDIFTDTGTGLNVTGTAVVNTAAGTGFRMTVPAGVATIAAAAGSAATLTSVTVDLQFLTISSTNAPGANVGVSLTNVGDGTTTAVFSAGTGSTITNAGGTDFLISGGNASVTYNGTITDDQGQLVSIANTTGDNKFFTGAITDGNDGDGTGISITGNQNATVRFSGGLLLSTGTAAAFAATGNNNNTTLEVCDENPCAPAATGALINTITTTTGTALNVANTNIGASNLEFRSITSNGAGSATGIILDTTGAVGGLRVKGLDGADGGSDPDAGSGGTISNKTGADGATTTGNGIYLNNTFNVRLAGMQLNDFQNSAIRGFAVNSFSLEDSVISGAVGTNSAPIEGAIAFGDVLAVGTAGLTGSSLIDQVNISGSIEHHVEVYNQTGTLNLTIRNSNIHDNTVASGSDGIQMEFRGTAQVFTNIASNQFSNNKSQAIQLSVLETANLHAIINGNTVTRGTQGNEGILLTNGGSSDLTTAITNNTVSGFGGVAIFVGQVPGQGDANSLLQATIQDNTVTSPASATNHAILAFVSSLMGQVSQARFLIDGNNVTYDSAAARAILVDAPDAGRTPAFNATVTDNIVTAADVNAVTMISVAARNGATGRSDIRGNDVNFTTAVGVTGINVREATAGSNVLARGTSASNDSGVVIAANNPLSTTTVIPSAADIPVVENNTILLPSAPTPPSLPSFVLLPNEEMDIVFIDHEIDPDVDAPEISHSEIETTQPDTPTYAYVSTFVSEVATKLGDMISPTVHAQVEPETGESFATTAFTLPAGESAVVKFRVTVDAAPYASGQHNIENFATVSGSNFTNVTTNTASIALDAEPDLTVTKTDGSGTTEPGELLSYTLTYSNSGVANANGAPQHAANVVLTETVPLNTTFNSGASTAGWSGPGCVNGAPAGTVCTLNVGPVNAGAAAGNATFTVNVPALLPVSAVNVPNTSTIAESPANANGTDRNAADNTSSDTDNIIGNWDGSASTDWNDPNNWSNNTVPPAGNNISVPNVANAPAVISQDATVGLLTLADNLSIGVNRTVTATGEVALGASLVDGLGTLEIDVDGTLTRTTGQVQSTLRKNFDQPDTFLYHVGTPGEYSPVNVVVTSLSAPTGELSVKATDGIVPATPPLSANSLQRYWTLDGTGITADVTFNYLQSDVVGLEAAYRTVKVTAGTATIFPNQQPCPGAGQVCVNFTANTIFVGGLTSFSDWSATQVIPTAAEVSVSGRVTTQAGRGIGGVRMILRGAEGNALNATTNTFGFYRFDNVEAGKTYILTPLAKQYSFTERVLVVDDNMDGINFVPEP